jgi:putative oxidoreductase
MCGKSFGWRLRHRSFQGSQGRPGLQPAGKQRLKRATVIVIRPGLKKGNPMASPSPIWSRICILLGRLIFAAVFAMAMSFKFLGINETAAFIGAANLPAPLLLAWAAAFFELALVLCFLTGAFFTEASLAAAAYVLFLGFVFHGPAHWNANQSEFGFFIDHFTFIAGLLFAAAHGPGDLLALKNIRLLKAGASERSAAG